MSCARCRELAEQVAFLKSELGLVRRSEEVEALREAFRLSTGEARMVLMLWQVRGRVVRRQQLTESVIRESDTRSDNFLNVYASRIRRFLGHDALETVYGAGYRLTAAGLDRVSKTLGNV